jgi:prepilin-type N-terminal cleavage/methylation domain-containing protein
VKRLETKTNKTGFTLIELLVVIAIIGLLASIVLLALNSARAKSRDATRLADVRELATAEELYYNDNNGYQLTAAGLGALAVGSAYIGVVPVAPTPIDGSCTAAQNTFTYTSATGTTYSLTFCLGGLTGGFAAGVHTASPTGII